MLNWDRISIGRGSEPPIFMKGGVWKPPPPISVVKKGVWTPLYEIHHLCNAHPPNTTITQHPAPLTHPHPLIFRISGSDEVPKGWSSELPPTFLSTWADPGAKMVGVGRFDTPSKTGVFLKFLKGYPLMEF
jgi:hypothetical protein